LKKTKLKEEVKKVVFLFGKAEKFIYLCKPKTKGKKSRGDFGKNKVL